MAESMSAPGSSPFTVSDYRRYLEEKERAVGGELRRRGPDKQKKRKNRPKGKQCQHNDWDNVRVTKGTMTLRCRVCQKQWHCAAAAVAEQKCLRYSEGRCRLGGRCSLVHISYKKQTLEERAEAKAQHLFMEFRSIALQMYRVAIPQCVQNPSLLKEDTDDPDEYYYDEQEVRNLCRPYTSSLSSSNDCSDSEPPVDPEQYEVVSACINKALF